MKKYILFSFLTALSMFLISCGYSAETTAQDEYTLTVDEQELVDLAYANRSVWETSKTQRIRYVNKNGYDFLLVSNSKGDGVFMETKYTLNTKINKVYEAHLSEYGLGDAGLVYGGVSYSSSSEENAKYQTICKAISGKSCVINPASN